MMEVCMESGRTSPPVSLGGIPVVREDTNRFSFYDPDTHRKYVITVLSDTECSLETFSFVDVPSSEGEVKEHA
jgi:hypothetical protein